MRKGIRMTLGVVASAMLVSACGGGSRTDDDADPALELVTKAFQLTGEETATLDLTQGDVVLMAALGSLTAGITLRGPAYFDFDSGIPEPGGGRGTCPGGEVFETAEDGIGVRDVLFEAFQCYNANDAGRSVLDGKVRIKISSAGGQVQGNVEPGIDGRTLASVRRESGDAYFRMVQAEGLVEYEGDADQDRSSTVGSRMLLAQADETASDQVTFRKGFEIFAGPDGAAFETETTNLSNTNVLFTIGGALIYRGEGLDAPCNVTGSYLVATSEAVTMDFSNDVERPIGGSLAIAAGEANASVEFLSDGDAVVTTANGATLTYQAPDVDFHCGFDP